MMQFEVLCSHCQRRLLVETPGTVVACPHCGLHLTVPSPTEAEADQASCASPTMHETESSPGTTDVPTHETLAEIPSAPGLDSSAEFVNSETVPQFDLPIESPESVSPVTESAEPSTPIDESVGAENQRPSDLEASEPTEALIPSQPATEAVPQGPSTSETLTATTATTGTDRAETQPSQGASEPVAQPSPSTTAPSQGVPRMLFILVVSYASAVTLACLVLLVKNLHPLESLPDIKPPMKDNKIGLKLIDEGASMPPGHTLQLNETERFGSLKVTPLRVARAPVEFVYYDDSEKMSKLPTKPVLKLWLRFENVSDDQVFAPLDQTLMLKSIQDKKNFGRFRANNFVCRVTDKKSQRQKVLVYNNSPVIPRSDWDLKGQHAGKELKPGEVIETYIATTEEGIDELTGELIWRLHLRKGYNCKSLRGVTTLIEVAFHSDVIQGES